MYGGSWSGDLAAAYQLLYTQADPLAEVYDAGVQSWACLPHFYAFPEPCGLVEHLYMAAGLE